MRALLLQLLLSGFAAAACRSPTPAYPRPPLVKSDPSLEVAFSNLTHVIGLITQEHQFDSNSFSVSLTSETENLWSYHHTARKLNADRPGANPVDGDTFYRVASITKIFTMHAILQLHASGSLSLDDAVSKYLSGLQCGPPREEGGIDWEHISLRALASQISGIPRDWSQGDILKNAEGDILHGLPSPTNTHLPKCFGFSNFSVPCNESDLYDDLRHKHPVFTPNQQPSYSNTGFEILGLVVANVSGMPFIDYVNKNILERHFVTPGATFEVPQDNVSALTDAGAWYWDVDLGIHIPAGGLYATTNGLDQYLRTVMTHYQSTTFAGPDVNMFAPQGYNFGVNSAYGLTWEIFRTNKILSDGRPVTFYTKGGGHPGYITIIIAMPDLGLGLTILCTGNKAGATLERLRELVTVEIVRAVDVYAERYTQQAYAGDYVFDRLIYEPDTAQSSGNKINSSLSLSYSTYRGLHVTGCISNGTDILGNLGAFLYGDPTRRLELQLVPSGQFATLHPEAQGEIWLGIIWEEASGDIWDDFCVNNVDGPQYDGRPLFEVVFYRSRNYVELTGLRTRLKRVPHHRKNYFDDVLLRVQARWN